MNETVIPSEKTVGLKVINVEAHDGNIKTIGLIWRCPVCHGPRGEITRNPYRFIDTWDNPCGHTDMYESVIREYEDNPYKVVKIPDVENGGSCTICLEWICPRCGADRGNPDDNGVHLWHNPCGHVDTTDSVMREFESCRFEVSVYPGLECQDRITWRDRSMLVDGMVIGRIVHDGDRIWRFDGERLKLSMSTERELIYRATDMARIIYLGESENESDGDTPHTPVHELPVSDTPIEPTDSVPSDASEDPETHEVPNTQDEGSGDEESIIQVERSGDEESEFGPLTIPCTSDVEIYDTSSLELSDSSMMFCWVNNGCTIRDYQDRLYYRHHEHSEWILSGVMFAPPESYSAWVFRGPHINVRREGRASLYKVAVELTESVYGRRGCLEITTESHRNQFIIQGHKTISMPNDFKFELDEFDMDYEMDLENGIHIKSLSLGIKIKHNEIQDQNGNT